VGREGSEVERSIDEQDLYAFEIVHDKYFVFKIGNRLYFRKLINRDFLFETMEKVKLNLREGLITELHQT
jgi:hypothetical protein